MSMIVSAIVGWVCGKLGDSVLKSVFENSELNRKIEGVVSRWAKSQAAFVEPEALFEAVDLVREGDQRREYIALQGKLLRCEWPDENQWHRALMEQWRYVLKTNEEAQAFFQLDEAEASEELRKLARAVQGLCKEYEKVFKWFVVDNLSWIREYLRDHLPGMTVKDIRACTISLSKLPVTGHELFGREEDLAVLDEAWGDEHTHILSLVAWGGIGKTALVNEWLNRMERDNYRGAERVYGWSFYSQGTREERQVSGDEFFAYALKWFGDADPAAGSPWDKGVRLAELVRGQRTLLILDGLEPLQYPPGAMEGRLKDQGLQGLLKELASSNDGLCVITTREAVKDVERSVGAAVKRVQLEDLSVEAGLELLKSLGIKGTDKELGEAVKDFGGHALALNLLGTYLDAVHEGEIRKRDLVPHLADEEEQGGHAKRVMESYENWLKGTAELDILYMMGLFDRPAPGGAIVVLREEPGIEGLTDKLVGLTDAKWKYAVKHLRVLRLLGEADEGNAGNLDCHPMIREHFGEKLKGANPDGWREAHGRLYEYYKGIPEKHLPDTLAEMEPLFAAVGHGCRAGRYQEAYDEVYCERIKRWNEHYSTKKLGAFGADLAAVSCFFEEAWGKPTEELTGGDKTVVLSWAGFRLRALGRLREAVEPMRSAVSKAIEQKNWQEAAIDAENLSGLYLTLGDLKAAVDYGRRDVEYADRSKAEYSWQRKVTSRTTLADALHQAGAVGEAKGLFEEAEGIQKERQPGHPMLSSIQGFYFCDLILSEGGYEEVEERARQALELAKEFLGRGLSLWDIGLDKVSLGRAYLLGAISHDGGGRRDDGRHREVLSKAGDYLGQAVDGLREAGTQDQLPRGLLGRAEYYRYAGEYEEAWGDLGEAREIAERGEMGLWLADCCLEGARLCLWETEEYRISNKEGRISKLGEGKQRIVPFGGNERVEMCGEEIIGEGRKYFEKARSEIEEMGYQRRRPEVLLIEAEVLTLEGKKEEGKKRLEKAKARIDEMGCHRWGSEVERIKTVLRF
ncbi:MAG: hypothetical protein FVQ85_09770 [Planctomycetes bacterium]|nr:hypothetical protein [Planctomycetota bacterium]